jgi:hypothetical protein
MKISTGSTLPACPSPGRTGHMPPASSAKRPVAVAVDQEVASQPSATTEGAGSESEPAAEEPRGVVGLLQEGHFKGVAAARLWINFFDKLPPEGVPEPTAPNSSGRAFEKFMEQYKALSAPTEPAGEPTQDGTSEPPPADTAGLDVTA